MRLHPFPLAALAAALAAGCADAPTTAAPDLAAKRERPADPRDPYGLAALVRAMEAPDPPRRQKISDDIELRFLGRGNLVETSPPEPVADADGADEHRPKDEKIKEHRPDHVGPHERLVAFNTGSLHEFEVIVSPRLLAEIHQARERAGLTRATEGVDDPNLAERETRGDPATDGARRPDEAVASLGWSNGDDSRIRWHTTTAWPRRAMASFTYGGNDSRCSGTLIGPRHVITAAHCIVSQGTNNWSTITVTPGRNGVGSAPFGSSTIMPNPAPGTSAWYFAPAKWRDPNEPSPRQWDWAMIVVPDRLGDATGWLGYVARPFGDIDAQTNYNRGYPSCDSDFVERPAGCVTGAMYGDVAECDLGGGSHKGPDGWNRLISASCDLSRGHSGSSVYHYFFDPALGKYVPVVSMMVVSHTCFTCSEADDFPNWARRITPDDLGTIGWLREAFP